MGFHSRPDIEGEVVSTCRLQPFVSKQRLDVPARAPVKRERRGRGVPEHMRGHSLQSPHSLTGVLHVSRSCPPGPSNAPIFAEPAA
jgi:hypothetical protein